MFRRRMINRLREGLPDDPRRPGPRDEEAWEERVQHLRHHFGPGRHFAGRHPFEWEHEAPFWFSPPGRPDRHFFGRGGPFGGDEFDEDGGARRRHRRGDIKYALLELLAEQPRHGYELIKELEQRYGGFYRPSPGTIYPTLQLLEDEGHLTSESVEGKRVYTITGSGRQLLEERRRQQPADTQGPHQYGFRRGAGPELHQLRESGMGLVTSVMQVARHGTPAQVQAVLKLLESTRREIYAILSQNESEGQE